MKKKKNGGQEGSANVSPKTDTRTVRITYHDIEAKSVFVAGTFNDWHPGVTEMIATKPGVWVKELALRPGSYEYRLVVDGRWTEDPNSAGFADNSFGGRNSVLRVD